MSVAEVLRKKVKDKGITYTYIAEKTGISVDSISKSFLGKRRLPAEEMVLICKATGIELELFADIADTSDQKGA